MPTAGVNVSYKVDYKVQETVLTNTAGVSLVSVPIGTIQNVNLTPGTGSGQADLQWSHSGILTSSTVTFDLTALVGVNGTVNMARVKFIYIKNLATSDTFSLILGNASPNGWSGPFDAATDTFTIPASGEFLAAGPLITGWITGGSNKNIKLDSGAHTVSYSIVIVGCSI